MMFAFYIQYVNAVTYVYSRLFFVLAFLLICLYLLYKWSYTKNHLNSLLGKLEVSHPYVYFVLNKVKFYVTLECQITTSLIKDIIKYGWIAWVLFYPILFFAAIIILAQTVMFLLYFLGYLCKITTLFLFKQDFVLSLKDNPVNIVDYLYRTAFYQLFVVVPKARAFLSIYFLLKFLQKACARFQFKYDLGVPVAAINNACFGPHTEQQLYLLMEEEVSYLLNKWGVISMAIIFLTFKLPLTLICGYTYYSIIMTTHFIRRAYAQLWVYEKGNAYDYFKYVVLHGIILGVPSNLTTIENYKISGTYLSVNEFGQEATFVDPRIKEEPVFKFSTPEFDDDTSLRSQDKAPLEPDTINQVYNSLFDSQGRPELSGEEYDALLKEEAEDDAFEEAIQSFYVKYPMRYRLLFNPKFKFSQVLNSLSLFSESAVSQEKWLINNADKLSIGWVQPSQNEFKKKHLSVLYKYNEHDSTQDNKYIAWSCSSKSKLYFKDEFTKKSNFSENALALKEAYNKKITTQYTTQSYLVRENNVNYKLDNNLFANNKTQRSGILVLGCKKMVFDIVNNRQPSHLNYSNKIESCSPTLSKNSLNFEVKNKISKQCDFYSSISAIENYYKENVDYLGTPHGTFWAQSITLYKLTMSGAYLINPQNPTQKLTNKDIINIQQNALTKENMQIIEIFYNGIFNNK